MLNRLRLPVLRQLWCLVLLSLDVPSVQCFPMLLIRAVSLRIKMANVHYQFCAQSAAQTACAGSLIDRGVNGGLFGSDVLILLETGRRCNVTGITNNAVTDLPIVQAAGLIQSSIGPIIGIFNLYASIRD